MQRNFESIRKHVEAWQRCELTDVTAKVVILGVRGRQTQAPKHPARNVNDLYLNRSMRNSDFG